MKITFEIQLEIGEVVYLKTDREQLPRFVVGYIIRPQESIVYDLQSGGESVTSHYAFEISKEINVLLNSTN